MPKFSLGLRNSLPESLEKKVLSKAIKNNAQKQIVVHSPSKSISKSISKSTSSQEVIRKLVSKNPSQKIVLQNSSQNSSNYFYKEKFQNLLTIEDGFYDPKPYRAVQKIFPPNWHFKPWSLSKPYEYYENILTETQSIKITHHYTNPNEPPSYSTAKILKIIHPMDWAKKNQFLSHHQKFQNRITTMDLCPTYSYWDYQQAWYNIFFIQNKMGYH